MPSTPSTPPPTTPHAKPAGTLRRATAALLTAAALFAGLALSPTLPTAAAQPAPSKQPARDTNAAIESIRFGIGDLVTESRWNQLTINVRGGSEPQNLRLSVTAPNDTTQNATYTRDFSTTPGIITTVSFNIFYSSSTSIIKVNLQGTGINDTVEVQRFMSESSLVKDFNTYAPGSAAVLTLTNSSALPTIPTEIESLFTDTTRGIRRPVPLVTIRPDELPTSHLALDTFSIIVLRAEQIDTLAPRQRIALKRWLTSGGSLVLIANQPASAWSSLLDIEDPTARLISLSDVRTDTPGLNPAYADLYTAAERLAPPRANLPIRTIRLSDRAIATGWFIKGKLATEPNSGLVACGPVGFGRLAILGFDPVAAEDQIVLTNVAKQYKHLFTKALELIPRQHWDPAAQRNNQPYLYNASDWSEENTAKQNAISSLANVAPLGTGIIWAFVIFGLALALMVGPGDLMLLKQLRLRHRSWISALVWIALACCAGYFVPPMIRASPTSANRLEVIDSLRLPEQTFNACTGISTIFAGGPINDALTGFHPTSSAIGISASILLEGTASLTLPSLTYNLTDDTTTVPNSFELRPWTLRSFLDSWTSSDQTFTPELTTDPATQKLRVTLPKLPAGARIASATLRTLRSDIALVAAGANADQANQLVEFDRNERTSKRSLFENVRDFADSVNHLHPASRHEASMNLRVRSGHSALLMLRIENLPLSVKLPSAQIATRTVYLRAVVQLPSPESPLPDSQPQPPADTDPNSSPSERPS